MIAIRPEDSSIRAVGLARVAATLDAGYSYPEPELRYHTYQRQTYVADPFYLDANLFDGRAYSPEECAWGGDGWVFEILTWEPLRKMVDAGSPLGFSSVMDAIVRAHRYGRTFTPEELRLRAAALARRADARIDR